MKNFLLGVFTTLAVLAAGTLCYLLLGFAEVRGDHPGSALETRLMRAAVHASVRRHAPEMPNPIAPTDDNLIAGGNMYLGECGGCHGAPGKVKPNDPMPLYPPIPQFPLVGTEYTEAQIFWVAKHGIRRSGMFSNGMWDSDQRLWTIAAFIKRMKSLLPHVTEELAKPAPSGGN